MGPRIPFNVPHLVGEELAFVAEASKKRLAGDGHFTKLCHAWLEERTGAAKALLTHSCTAALEMAALLLDIAPGDEIIMPSYTFVSTANAFVLRGGVPVFVDIREDTLNLDEKLVESAMTPRTRAIVPVHYAGVACEMDSITSIASRHGLAVVEDAAQGLGSLYKGRPLGSLGRFGAYSFHETKNVISGEGGALLVNDPAHTARAEIVREKGTDRSRFLRGEVDKYTWQDIGSSFLPSEIIAAFLWAQLGRAEAINAARHARWQRYHDAFSDLERAGHLRRPVVPAECMHNAHMYYVILGSVAQQKQVATRLAKAGIQATSHYVPLHASPAGQKYGRVRGHLAVTESICGKVLRLPLYPELSPQEQEKVVSEIGHILRN